MSIITTKITGQLYEFTECADLSGNGRPQPYVDAYLLIGKKRAALIDALQYTQGLYEEVRKYTDLPVDVLITHGHGDHAGRALSEFAEAGCHIYMSLVDYEWLISMASFVKKEWFTDISDGDVYDLGGYTLQAIACGGHTPGSVAFLEKEMGYLFSGDTIGSGSFWLQLPSSLPVSRFLENVSVLWEKVKEIPDLLVYPGHRNQSPVQLTIQYVSDCRYIAAGLVDGTLEGVDKVLDMPGRHMEFKTVAYGQMLDFCYAPGNI